jgi:hypothetical protein
MALNDAQLASDLVAALGSIHAGAAGRDAFGAAIKDYAAGATLTVPATGLTPPVPPASGQATASVTFTGSVLDGALASLFGSNHSRAEARDAFVSAIQAYAATASATVASTGLASGAGPFLPGTSAAGPPTFNGSALTAAINSLYAQDNDTNFAASLLAAAISAYFKSGTMPVVSTYTAPTALGPPGPVVGTATGTIG